MILVPEYQGEIGDLLAGQSGCREQPINPHMPSVSRMMAKDRHDWMPGWTETHSPQLWVEGSSSPGVAGQARAGLLVAYAG